MIECYIWILCAIWIVPVRIICVSWFVLEVSVLLSDSVRGLGKELVKTNGRFRISAQIWARWWCWRSFLGGGRQSSDGDGQRRQPAYSSGVCLRLMLPSTWRFLIHCISPFCFTWCAGTMWLDLVLLCSSHLSLTLTRLMFISRFNVTCR